MTPCNIKNIRPYNRMSDEITTIAADYIYLVFLGASDIIGKIVNKLNEDAKACNGDPTDYKTYRAFKNKPINIYVKNDISKPCVRMLESQKIQEILRNDAIKRITDSNRSKSKDKISKEIIDENDIESCIKYVELDEGIETAQCLTYADITDNNSVKRKTPAKNLSMLMVLNEADTHYKLSFPVLQLDEEENPDKLISGWLKEHNLENDIVKELVIRPTTIVGKEHDILVFAAFVNE
jgi:hypothetical protein